MAAPLWCAQLLRQPHHTSEDFRGARVGGPQRAAPLHRQPARGAPGLAAGHDARYTVALPACMLHCELI
jgi:hypothetical protein